MGAEHVWTQQVAGVLAGFRLKHRVDSTGGKLSGTLLQASGVSSIAIVYFLGWTSRLEAGLDFFFAWLASILRMLDITAVPFYVVRTYLCQDDFLPRAEQALPLLVR